MAAAATAFVYGYSIFFTSMTSVHPSPPLALGVLEIVVVAGVAALVFGPKKLPVIGRSVEASLARGTETLAARERELQASVEELHAARAESATKSEQLRRLSNVKNSLEAEASSAVKQMRAAQAELQKYLDDEPARLAEFKKEFLQSEELTTLVSSRLMTFLKHDSRGTIEQFQEKGLSNLICVRPL